MNSKKITNVLLKIEYQQFCKDEELGLLGNGYWLVL